MKSQVQIRILLLAMLFLTFDFYAAAQFTSQPGENQYDVGNPQSDPQAWQDQIAGDFGVDIDIGTGEGLSYNEQTGVLRYSGGDIDLKDFSGSSIEINGDTVIVDGQELSKAKKTAKRGKSIYATDVQSAEMSGGEPYIFDHVERLEHDGIVVNEGSQVEFDGVEFHIASADSIVIDGGIATQVLDFRGGRSAFRVTQADSVQIRCLTLRDVYNTDFFVSPGQTKAEPDKNEELRITDCAQSEATYNAGDDAGLTITEQRPVSYTVENGQLIYESATHQDILISESPSEVSIDFFDGFSCLTLSPQAAYYYVDKLDTQRDLTVRNPGYGLNYDLCLKRSLHQMYPVADGYIDFMSHGLELSGVIDVLKYPVAHGAISSLELWLLYSGLTDQIFEAVLDEQFRRVSKSNLSVQWPQVQTVARLHPNNFYDILHEPIGGGIHQLVRLNEVDAATDSLVEEYGNVNISEDGVLNTGNMRVLPPNHPEILELLNG